MLLCGAAKREINPDLPVKLVGYGPHHYGYSIHDDLEVNCIYLKRGDAEIALLAYDSETTDAEFVAEIQAACAAETGLAERSILATVTHCHSTPLIRRRRAFGETTGLNEPYRARVIERSREVLSEAVSAAVPVKASYNCARVRENLNRRVFFPDGTYFYQPKHKNLLSVADGPVDDELGVVFFRAADDSGYVATIVNYTAHALTVGDTANAVSADFPGAVRREIEANIGGVGLFINGACGDNHPLGAEAGFGRCERMGQALAEKALYHRWDAVELADAPLGSEYREILLPMKTRSDHDLIPGSGAVEYRPVRDDLLEGTDVRTYFSLWALGPVLFAGVPGEMTAELGLALKWQSPFPKAYVMYMATDHIGYIPHRNAYEWGGYEALTSPFGPAAGGKLLEEMLAAAAELKGRLESSGGKCRLPMQ